MQTPLLHQVVEVKEKLKGQTAPYAVVLDTDQEAVIKLICQQGCVCFKEYLAIQMAKKLGFPTLTPLQLKIPPELLKTLPRDQWIYQQMNRHTLLPAFGTLYLPATRQVMAQDLKKPALWPEICRIFCFDLLIRNFDRKPVNPNLLFRTDQGPQIVLIDHEMAFQHAKQPWKLNQNERFEMQQHLCFAPLKEKLTQDYARQTQTIHAFMNEVDAQINTNFWQMVQKNVPQSWLKPNDLTAIQQTIAGIIKHKTEFMKTILEVLT